jgi:hypothetical protein
MNAEFCNNSAPAKAGALSCLRRGTVATRSLQEHSGENEMKIEDVKIGMKVKGQNYFGVVYEVTEVNGNLVTVKTINGDMVMKGGKMVKEEFFYTYPSSMFTPHQDTR